MTVGELLRIKGNVEILKISESECIADAATKLTKNKIGALLVENASGDIVGIISERDIVGGIGVHGTNLNEVPVSELMTTKLIRCKPSDKINAAMAMMTDRHFRHLPIFNEDELVGFISLGDLVKQRISEVQAEADAMRQYIAT